MKNGEQQESTRLLAALPDGDFINRPEEIDRFTVHVFPDGKISFKGSRARVEEFLQACKEVGLVIEVDYISLCG